MKKILFLLSILPGVALAKSRYVDGTPLSSSDKAAINQNFSDADRIINGKVPLSAEKVTINISTFNVNGRIRDSKGFVAPVGAVQMYAGATAPNGWLLCDGSSVLRTDYSDLFAISTCTYGCADGTHFNLPDMRGVFPKGAGTTTRAAGIDASSNAYAGTLGTYSQDMMQGHVHRRNPDGYAEFFPFTATTPAQYSWPAGAYAVTQNGIYTGTPYADATNGTPRTGHTTEPQSLGMSFIIKY